MYFPRKIESFRLSCQFREKSWRSTKFTRLVQFLYIKNICIWNQNDKRQGSRDFPPVCSFPNFLHQSEVVETEVHSWDTVIPAMIYCLPSVISESWIKSRVRIEPRHSHWGCGYPWWLHNPLCCNILPETFIKKDNNNNLRLW